jgi:hypothetical protein
MRNVPEILERWAALTEFDPEARVFNLGGIDVRGMAESIRRAQDLDPTDALAVMLLESFLDSFLSARTYTAAQILADMPRHMGFLGDARDLRALIAGSGVVEARAALAKWTMGALAHYGAAERPKVLELVARRDALPFLRRDAYRAVDDILETHQFLQGEPDGAKPRVLEHIVEATSLPALLRAAAGMPSGILVALVREPDPVHSYFVVVVRNGGTLTALTDRTRWATPFQKAAPRRPERHLEHRMERTHFPYGLLSGLAGDDAGDGPHGREVMAPGMTARRLCPIKDLAPEETVWLAMLVDVVSQRFFREDRRLPTLSHLGAQVRVAAAPSGDGGLPALLDAGIDAPPLRSADLDAAAVHAIAATDRPRGERPNLWLEERYRGMVDDRLLNLVAETGEAPVLLGRDGGRLDNGALEGLHPFERSQLVSSRMMSLQADDFASREALLADRALLGRHNQVLEINRFAAEEFERRREEIERWWLRTMKRRTDALLAAVSANTLPAFREHSFRHGSTCWPRYRGDLLRVEHKDDIERGSMDNYTSGILLADGTHAKAKWRRHYVKYDPSPRDHCLLRGYAPSWRVRFSPREAQDLAILAGVPVAKLPDVLRGWVAKPERAGNSMLDRLDPLDWMGRDPWRDLDFRVEFWLSESGMAQAVKRFGGPGPERAKPRVPAPAEA